MQQIIEEESATAGRTQWQFSQQEIVGRILGIMQTEGAAILNDGIAESVDDIDLVMVLGYGFPRRKGGPMFMAAS